MLLDLQVPLAQRGPLEKLARLARQEPLAPPVRKVLQGLLDRLVRRAHQSTLKAKLPPLATCLLARRSMMLTSSLLTATFMFGMAVPGITLVRS